MACLRGAFPFSGPPATLWEPSGKTRLPGPHAFTAALRLKSERRFWYQLCGPSSAPPGQTSVWSRAWPSIESSDGAGGSGTGRALRRPSKRIHTSGKVWVTDRAAGQGCQSERPRETQTNITCSVKAFPGDNHRNNTLDTVTGHIWQLLKKQPSPLKPLGGSKVPLAQFKKSRKEEGPRVREGCRSSDTNYLQLPSACPIQCRMPPASTLSLARKQAAWTAPVAGDKWGKADCGSS